MAAPVSSRLQIFNRSKRLSMRLPRLVTARGLKVRKDSGTEELLDIERLLDTSTADSTPNLQHDKSVLHFTPIRSYRLQVYGTHSLSTAPIARPIRQPISYILATLMSPQPGLGLRTRAVFSSPSGYFSHAPCPAPDPSPSLRICRCGC